MSSIPLISFILPETSLAGKMLGLVLLVIVVTILGGLYELVVKFSVQEKK